MEKELEKENMFSLMEARRRKRNKKGLTTVAYAIMLALVALASAEATPSVKDPIVSIFGQVASALAKIIH